MDEQSSNLSLRFSGPALESGRISAVDFIQSTGALAELLQIIYKETEKEKGKKIEVELIALNRGSFEADLLITLRNLGEFGVAVTPLIPNLIGEPAKQIIELLKSVIEAKKFLRGENPSRIEILQDRGSPHVSISNNTGTINLNINTYNLLQDEGTNKKLQKFVKPLLKENGEVKSIELGGQDVASVGISSNEAVYFEKEMPLQSARYNVRGIITALDRKTQNGKISIGDKRVNFEVEIEDIANLDKVMDGLIESMKNKLSITVTGEGIFDFESNLKRLKIIDIEKDPKLF